MFDRVLSRRSSPAMLATLGLPLKLTDTHASLSGLVVCVAVPDARCCVHRREGAVRGDPRCRTRPPPWRVERRGRHSVVVLEPRSSSPTGSAGCRTSAPQIDGLLCTAAAEGQSAALYQLDRARSLRQFVALRTRTNPADVGADLALGTWLVTFPVVARALAAGRITRRHAQHLRELDNPRTHRHLLDGIDYLTDAATDCSWKDFVDICNDWLANADPDGTLPDETSPHPPLLDEEARRRRPARILRPRHHRRRRRPQRHRTRSPPPLLHRRRPHPPRSTHPQPHPTHGRRPRQPGDAWRAAHRPHRRRTPHPRRRRPPHPRRSHLPQSRRRRRRCPDRTRRQPFGDDLGIDPHNPLRRCELIDGTPLHPNQVLALLGVATIRRLVLDTDSEILDIGRASRKFPQYMKDAMLAAQRGQCSEHGCDARPSWLHADHIIPWTPNDPWQPAGRTATRNLQMLCGSANHAKSNGPNLPTPTPRRRMTATTPPTSEVPHVVGVPPGAPTHQMAGQSPDHETAIRHPPRTE